MNTQNIEEVRLELTRLIGKKELTFGCLVKTKDKNYEGKPMAKVIKSFDGIDTSYTGYSHTTDNITIWIPFGGRYNEGKVKPICSFSKNEMEIIGHPATLSDFHRYVNDKHFQWKQLEDVIYIVPDEGASIMIMYNSSKDFLDQYEETLKQIVSLVKETKLIKSNQ